jgi:hypothetical protein
MGFKFIFHVFFEEFLHAAMWLETTQGLKGRVLRKNLHRILDFHFFSLFFWLMILHDAIFNVTAKI